MVFSSSLFLFIFFPVAFLLYYNPFFKNRSYKNSVLLICSLFFYAWGEPKFVFLMLLSIILNFWFGKKIDSFNEEKSRRKLCLFIAITWNVLLLFVFKYLSFFSNIFVSLSGKTEIPVLEIRLPIGISFFTFQIMSYIFDIYYKKVPVQKNVMNLALYVSFFPQLIAGPIVRYETVAAEIQDRHETPENITNGIKRFVLGLSKKVLLANYMAVIADLIFDGDFNSIVNFNCLNAWIGAVSYTLQIYFDFSGYSDMAIGLGLIFGFHFQENFDHPYIASSIKDFWRRWHISLSSWFRDYVYIPLGGNRCKKSRALLNMFVVWLLTGIWHGAAFTFWLWGLYYFLLLLIERTFNLDKCKNIFARIIMHVTTIVFVIVGWVLFRSKDISSALIFLKKMFSFCELRNLSFFENYYIKNGGIMLLIGLFCIFPIISLFKKFSLAIENRLERINCLGKVYNIFANAVCAIMILAAFIASILICIKSTYNPFIYFNF